MSDIPQDKISYSLSLCKYDDDKLIDEIVIESYGSLEELLDELQREFDQKGWNQFDSGESAMNEYPNANDQFIDEVVPTDKKLTKIADAANNLLMARNRVDELEQQLQAAKTQYNYLSEIELPELMQSVGMSEFRLINGMKLKIGKVLACKLDKSKVDEADTWLANNGHEGLMKHKFEIPLPRTVTPLGLATLRTTLESLGYGFVDNKNIHPQTLNKWAREMSENNEVIPPEYFEVYRGYKTNIQE